MFNINILHLRVLYFGIFGPWLIIGLIHHLSSSCIVHVLLFYYSVSTLQYLYKDMDLLVQIIELEREVQKGNMKPFTPGPSGLMKPVVVKGKHLLYNSLT